jgi:hypothetical protein
LTGEWPLKKNKKSACILLPTCGIVFILSSFWKEEDMERMRAELIFFKTLTFNLMLLVKNLSKL